MLYLLTSEIKQSNWQPYYENTYVKQLQKNSIPFEFCSLDGFPNCSSQDFVWVMHFNHLHKPQVINCKAKVIYRMSGTSTHPYCYQVDMEKEVKELTEIIDVNMSFHPRMTEYVKKFFPDINIITTGYPIEVPVLENAVKQKRIVVGGRLSPDKQFMLSTYLLQPFLSDYEIVFCYPDYNGKDSWWLEQYGGKERYERLGFKFLKLDKLEWLEYLNASEFFFISSLGDTACVSCVEAVSLGVYPLVPKIEDGLPVYDTYIDIGYEPFSKKSLSELIRTKPDFNYDDTYTNPDKWTTRFKSEVLCVA